MIYSEKCRHGIISRPAQKAKVYLHRCAKYGPVLKKITDEIFGTGALQERAEYYLADSSGLPVCSRGDGNVAVQTESGEESLVPWTLESYMAISGAKFQCKVKLYCVKKELTRGIIIIYI